MLLYPRITRAGLLFGIYVGPERSRSDAARAITRAWYRGMLTAIASALALGLFLGSRPGSPFGMIAPALLLGVAVVALYLRAYGRARQLAPTGETPLAVAAQSERVSFIQGAAEGIPFAAAEFDLATVCSGIHWLRREALGELHRVLKIDGSLVVYDVWFPADMVDEPQFADWMSVTCGPRYPSVPKKQDNLMALLDMGFRPTWSADLRHEVRMDLESLVDYLMTHSERIAAIQDGRETEAEQAEFFEVGLRSLFPDEIRRALLFGISVHAFQCQPSAAAPA
jgi:SAM-dependent methyltransferase